MSQRCTCSTVTTCSTVIIKMLRGSPQAKRCLGYIASSDLRLLGGRLPNVFLKEHRKWLSTKSKQLPQAAEIVIAGGGITGSSVAYHLAKNGKSDVVVLEQGSLGCGTTWHSVGLVSALRWDQLQYKMTSYGIDLYSNLEEETGLTTGIKRCGTLMVARTKDREISVRRLDDRMRQFGKKSELLSPGEAQNIYPLVRSDDLKLALWAPDDGVLNASDACSSFMRGATLKGVQFFDGIGVQKVHTNGKRVIGVQTDQGFVHCDKFINCGGQWARDLALQTDDPVHLPLHSCEHFYIVTKPMEGVHSMLPALRDQDAYIYIREWSGGLLVGGFEPMGKSCFYEGVPDKFEFQLLQEDWDHFEILLQGTTNRIPSIEKAEIRQFVNGPESFTPDGKPLFGEVPEVKNYFSACGMNSGGVVGAPGMGRLTAELVINGQCSWDTSVMDVKRLPREQNNKFFLRDRVKQVLGQNYAMNYPDLQNTAGRPLKTSPLYDVLSVDGAEWGEVGGWERVNWFRKQNIESVGTFGKPCWFENVRDEWTKCTSGAGIADMSWQSKFKITANEGSNLVDELQRLFANDVDLTVGGSVTSAILNERGKYVAVVDLHRVSDDRFFLVIHPNYHNTLISWISENSRNSLTIEDVTSRYACVGFFGPNAINLLQKLTLKPLNDFAVNRSERIDLGNASNVVMHRGYLGDCNNWQAFVPVELCRGLYNNIIDVGSVKNIGHYAINALRVGHGLPAMGIDFGPLSSPAEFGKVSFVNPNKESEFIGKEAVRNSIQLNAKSLITLNFECDDDNWAWGGETVFADGEPIGNLASVSYDFSQNKMIAFSVLQKEKAMNASDLTVRIASKDKQLQLKDIKGN